VKHPRVWRFVAALIHGATISITSWAISRTSVYSADPCFASYAAVMRPEVR
jgi:hypothetical protein